MDFYIFLNLHNFLFYISLDISAFWGLITFWIERSFNFPGHRVKIEFAAEKKEFNALPIRQQ